MNFEFATAGRIIFGPGKMNRIGGYASDLGRKAMVVHGIQDSFLKELVEILERHQIEIVIVPVKDEPTIDSIQEGTETARKSNCDLVISIGGGSAIDTGKAISALQTNPGDLIDYLEIIGYGKPLRNSPIPFIAIPTTAGTGAEVTRNAVINAPDQRVKVSLRSPKMLPEIALVDPELTVSMPPNITAFTGLDALTQLIEPFVSKFSNPFTDAISREGIRLVGKSIKQAYKDGKDISARIDMSLSSLFGGMALANAKLGAVHGIAGPFGGMYHAPHGAVCARLLPYVMEQNLANLQKEGNSLTALIRYTEIAQLLTGDTKSTASEGVDWVKEIVKLFEIPPLGRYGFVESELDDLVQKSKNASSMRGNPVELTNEEIEYVILQAT